MNHSLTLPKITKAITYKRVAASDAGEGLLKYGRSEGITSLWVRSQNCLQTVGAVTARLTTKYIFTN